MEAEILKLANLHYEKRCYTSAAFYADKLVSISGGNPEYVYLLASCYFQNAEYPRVVHLLEKTKLIHKDFRMQALAGQATVTAGDFQNTIRILSEEVEDPQGKSWKSLKFYYLGRAHEAKESIGLAAEHYKQALLADPTCLEAFNALIDRQLISASEEIELVSALDLEPWIKEFYLTKLKFHQPPGANLQVLEQTENLDVLLSKASQLFSSHKVEQAYEVSSKILREDPFHLAAVPLHCGCMASLGLVGELYNLAHNLVKDYKGSPAAWYAAGIYYYVIKKYEYSRKFFMKAFKMEKEYLPAWLGYGHTYAAQDQSDQAMSAYRSVARLFPGCYLANLYMGMEYLRTKNLRTALLSFELAKKVNENDAVVWNEIGVVLYKKQDFHRANEVLEGALKLCEGVMHTTAEAIIFNLAHTYRKLKNYEKAIEYYHKCIQLNSRNASTYSAIGLTFYLNGQVHDAVDAFNKALFLKSNDRFTNDLLYIALFECAESPPLEVNRMIQV